MFGRIVKNASKYIEYIKNNTGKSIIFGGTAFMIGDSCVFMKQTSVSNYMGTEYVKEKYINSQDSLYSDIMRPFRRIKDFIWIYGIHNMIHGVYISKPNNYKLYSKSNYSNFLKDYPYPKYIFNDIQKNGMRPKAGWLTEVFFDEFSKNTNDSNLYTPIQLQILDIFREDMYHHHHKDNPYFVDKLLKYVSSKDEDKLDHKTINWCLSELEYSGNKINVSYETILKLPHKYAEGFLYYKLIDSRGSKVDMFVSGEHKLRVCTALKFLEIGYYLSQNKSFTYNASNSPYYDASVNFLKKESNLIECLQCANESENYEYYPSVNSLLNIGYCEKTINKLIENGHYLITKLSDDKLEEIVNKNNNISVEKVLINQKNIKSDIVQKLLILYEKQNPHITWTELNCFVKKHQPKYYKEMHV
jgi:hypothetical protein